jgi:large subunit ribosomal protein L18
LLQKQGKNIARKKRHIRVRKHIAGTQERPRLNVFRSLNHIYAQIINDETRTTLISASTIDKEVAAALSYGGNVTAAQVVGKTIAERAIAHGIKKVVFDRGGYLYHGRVAALAAAAREAGLEF